LKTYATKSKVNKKLVAVGVAVIYIIVIGIGILSGNWQNSISKKEYLIYRKNIHSLGHPRSAADIDKLNRMTGKQNNISPKENTNSKTE